jgi:hypothetical protein
MFDLDYNLRKHHAIAYDDRFATFVLALLHGAIKLYGVTLHKVFPYQFVACETLGLPYYNTC